LGNDHYECKFYESMDLCWSQVKFIFKHVLIFINDMDLQNENMK